MPSPGLYETDGTPGNTTRLTSVNASLNSNIVSGGNRVYFEDVVGFIWTSDGTAAGTVPVDQTNSLATNLMSVNGSLFYLRPTAAMEITGTTAFTISGSYRTPKYLTNVDGTVYFAASDTTTGHPQLWKCPPGSTTGTPVIDNIALTGAAAVGGSLYFTAGNSTAGYTLYRSDGMRRARPWSPG